MHFVGLGIRGPQSKCSGSGRVVPEPEHEPLFSIGLKLTGRDLRFSSFAVQLPFFCGTLAPFFRASESPIAMACLRLFTFPPLPPLPERSVPFFLRRIALATVFPADLLYLLPLDFFRELDFFFAAMHSLPLFRGKDCAMGCANLSTSESSGRNTTW
jgi:hypothetical protein